MVEKNCLICDKKFKIKPHEIGVRKHCSKSCAGKSLIGNKNPNWKNGISYKNPFIKIEKKEKFCIICARKFLVYPSRINKLYCSNNCRGLGRRKIDSLNSRHHSHLCKRCSKSIVGKLRYCSKECRVDKSKKITKRCSICLSEFRFWRHRPKIYCSRKCYGKAMSISQTAEGSHFWKGGMTDWKMRIRTHPLYKEWRDKIFKRDDYTCQSCLKHASELRKGKLCAHHIKTFKDEPRLALKVSNGITLCWQCHKDFHTFFANGKLATDETDLKEKCQKYFKKESGICFFKIHGGNYQEVGIPDFLGCVAGQFVGIELKIFPNFIAPIQKHQLKRIETAGGKIFVCYSLEEVKRAVYIVKESMKENYQYEL